MPIAAGQTYALTVHDVPSGAASGTPYNLQFSGCAFVSTGSNHPPVALARDVNVVADANHSANASVDNGSYDPDLGDIITLTQTPASPYRAGATPVVLTVVDSQGASAQANATVTVVEPDFDFGGLVLPAKTVNAGDSVTQTITIRPNPAPWNSVVGFTCSGLPPLTTYTFNPTAVVPGSSDAITTLTVATTGRSATLVRPSKGSALATCVTFVGLGLFVVARSRHRKCGRRLFSAVLVFGILSLPLIDCGGASTAASGGTPVGRYTITVTATSGGVTHSAIFQLEVN